MSGTERWQRTLSLWPYMVPLFTVFFAEYTLQVGMACTVVLMRLTASGHDAQWLWVDGCRCANEHAAVGAACLFAGQGLLLLCICQLPAMPVAPCLKLPEADYMPCRLAPGLPLAFLSTVSVPGTGFTNWQVSGTCSKKLAASVTCQLKWGRGASGAGVAGVYESASCQHFPSSNTTTCHFL